MSIAGISGTMDSAIYTARTQTSEAEKESFYEVLNEVPEQEQEESSDVKEASGHSFWDLINSGKGNQQISVVNKIVSAKNPEDGKIYITYFTDEQISCNDGMGNWVWNMELDEGKRSRVADFFSEYKPDRDIVKEYYSNPALGQAASKDFWLSLFEDKEE